jgi:glycosyltransferase involved in cell wall biosynthesis
LVSILIPCFNAERWIGQAIESALAQTYSPTEIIVVDDGSTDRSLDIIKGFGQRIRWETGPNRGANATRNRLLTLARAPWLQYLDVDDYLLPDKVERQMSSEPSTRTQTLFTARFRLSLSITQSLVAGTYFLSQNRMIRGPCSFVAICHRRAARSGARLR